MRLNEGFRIGGRVDASVVLTGVEDAQDEDCLLRDPVADHEAVPAELNLLVADMAVHDEPQLRKVRQKVDDFDDADGRFTSGVRRVEFQPRPAPRSPVRRAASV